MGVESYFERIERYLSKESGLPLIVDVQNPQDLHAIITHFDVGDTQLINANRYSKTDELPRLEALLHDLSSAKQPVLVTGIGTFLKLQGDTEQRKALRELLSMSVPTDVVFLTYQCRKALSFKDPRLGRRIIIVDSQDAPKTDVILTTKVFAKRTRGVVATGIEHITELEERAPERLLIITGKTKAAFPLSLIPLQDLNRPFEIISASDPLSSNLQEAFGSAAQWEYALDLFADNGSWTSVVDRSFGNHNSLDLSFHSYPLYSENQRWLYFIALKLFGAPNNVCLNSAASQTDQEKDLVKSIYRSILGLDRSSKHFWEFYRLRKMLLKQAGNPIEEVSDYCRLITIKGKDALYYLTDNTQKEKETIFAVLDQHGQEFTKDELLTALNWVYPDLKNYLSPYRFKNALLDSYFEDYKYQKVINKVFPEFLEIVEEQATKREYNLILQPRASLIESIDRTGAQLYFVDAMGVEYLGFILAVCQEMGIFCKISIASCELPSITSKNKEFLDFFADGQHPVISVKDLDEIKHHGKDTYNYERTKLPIHLAKELEIIRNILSSIKEKLVSRDIQKAVLIADHGASRLAVIHETENIWEMSEKGEHSGRCCLKSELDCKPEFATDAGDFWALANYDRFRGSRKANVEVHGGATLEEVTVPIIELTYSSQSVEVYLLAPTDQLIHTDDVPEITVSFRKKALIRIYTSVSLPDISVEVNGKRYDARPIDNNFNEVEMPDVKRPKTYYVDVFSGENLIATKLPLIVKSEGMGSTNKGIL